MRVIRLRHALAIVGVGAVTLHWDATTARRGFDVVMGKGSTPSTAYYFDHQTGSLVAVIVQEIVGYGVGSRPYVDYKSVCVGGPPEVLGFSDLPKCNGTRSCPFEDAGLPLTPSDAATD
jgi:hypothetical protein